MVTIKMKLKDLMMKIENQNSGNKDLEKEMLEDLAMDCNEYISCIVKMENTINLAKTRLETKEYQEIIITLDRSRTTTHNVVISDVKVLNKLSVLYELPLIFTGNVDNRIEVAEFAKLYLDELFNERRI
ncbi:DUF3232 domain-containing protein [Clostridium sp.]|uniref:DUF3232 domain-containing protein n=1 Tax=Clostridium sp. TaxID=1506 RepID=UPI001A3FB079|nr:DUF3232 domain-containing protein [Clostridium sp.]MBK5237327.1 DUF3232 domain-containing protein [Clostridium sp.]